MPGPENSPSPASEPASLLAENASSAAGPPKWALVVAAVGLACLILAVFHPIKGFEFGNYDAPEMIENNPFIRGLTWENVQHIFTSRSITSYYPVRTLTFALNYQLGGLQPAGFEIANGLLHFLNTLLVLWLVLRVFGQDRSAGRGTWWDTAAATLAAGIFAVHPVVVEPVTWIPGREELLLALGALGCIHCHFNARQQEQAGGKRWKAWAWHLGAALACAVACLSNAAGAVVPLLVVAWDLLASPRPTWRQLVAGTALLWPIAIGTIVLKKMDPLSYRYAMDIPALSWERPRVMLDVFGLNLKTVLWPTALTLNYTQIDLRKPYGLEEAFGIAAIGLLCALCWLLRRRPWILLGVVWFLVALAPSSQIIPHHIARADRFLYLPLAGVALAVGVAVRSLAGTMRNRAAAAGLLAAGVACLLLLAGLSTRQVQTWRTPLSLWEHGVSVAPDNPTAHRGLAGMLARARQFDGAATHYEQALALDPDDANVMNDYAQFLSTCEDPTHRDYPRAIQLARRACNAAEGREPRFKRTLSRAYMYFAIHLYSAGRYAQALDCFDNATRADDSYDMALLNQASALATCKDERWRNPDEAIRLAHQACRLSDYQEPRSLEMLATALASARRFPDAADAMERAAQVASAAGNSQQARVLQSGADFYRRMAAQPR